MKRLAYRIALALARRRYAKALLAIDSRAILETVNSASTFPGRRHRWTKKTFLHPDGTTSDWWEPSRRRRPDLFDEQTAASIARRELPYDYPEDKSLQAWHTKVPFDRRHRNPYTIQSHR